VGRLLQFHHPMIFAYAFDPDRLRAFHFPLNLPVKQIDHFIWAIPAPY
jgi:hypothetical protein